jgi:hypothetical protein
VIFWEWFLCLKYSTGCWEWIGSIDGKYGIKFYWKKIN